MNKEKAFVTWAKEHNYDLKKDAGIKLFFEGALTLTDIPIKNTYSSTHTESAWQSWEAAWERAMEEDQRMTRNF